MVCVLWSLEQDIAHCKKPTVCMAGNFSPVHKRSFLDILANFNLLRTLELMLFWTFISENLRPPMPFSPILTKTRNMEINGDRKFSQVKVQNSTSSNIRNTLKFAKISRKDLLCTAENVKNGYRQFDHSGT